MDAAEAPAEAAPAPAAKAAKAKAPKVKKPSALLSECVQTLFLRPFIRRMKFLYTGMVAREHVYVLGTHDEADFKFCDPDQAIGMVAVHHPEWQALLAAWFTALGLDLTQPGALHLVDLAALLNKAKWEMEALTLVRHEAGHLSAHFGEQEVVVYHPITAYFVFDKTTTLAQEYLAVFLDGHDAVHEEPLCVEEGAVHLAKITEEAIRASPLGAAHPSPVRMLLTRGLDLLQTKPVQEQLTALFGVEPALATPGFVGLRLWNPSGRGVCYGHVLASPAVTMAAVRCNAFVLPRYHPPSQETRT